MGNRVIPASCLFDAEQFSAPKMTHSRLFIILQRLHASWPQIIIHDDVIKWIYFSRYWPFVRGIHWSPVNSPHKGQWRGALISSLICAWINGWVNNRKVDDLRRHRAQYDVIVMSCINCPRHHCITRTATGLICLRYFLWGLLY